MFVTGNGTPDVCLWVPGVEKRERSRAKDPTDAELALEVLWRQPEKLQRLEPEFAAEPST